MPATKGRAAFFYNIFYKSNYRFFHFYRILSAYINAEYNGSFFHSFEIAQSTIHQIAVGNNNFFTGCRANASCFNSDLLHGACGSAYIYGVSDFKRQSIPKVATTGNGEKDDKDGRPVGKTSAVTEEK